MLVQLVLQIAERDYGLMVECSNVNFYCRVYFNKGVCLHSFMICGFEVVDFGSYDLRCWKFPCNLRWLCFTTTAELCISYIMISWYFTPIPHLSYFLQWIKGRLYINI